MQVRVERRSVRSSIKGAPSLKAEVARNLNTTSDAGGAVDFFNQYGTHLIQQYIAGDAIYQVLVYDAASTNWTDFTARLATFETVNATSSSWIQLFTPPPFYTGRLMVHQDKILIISSKYHVLRPTVVGIGFSNSNRSMLAEPDPS